jgi:hypothetical protein
MKRLLSIFIVLVVLTGAKLLAPPAPVHAQMLQAIVGAQVTPSVTLPAYVTNSYCGFGGGSCSLTVSVGDFVVMNCNAVLQSGTTVFTPSSSPSAAWNSLTTQTNGSNTAGQWAWAIMSTAGSTSFSCPPSPGQNYPQIQIYQYTGGSGTRSVVASPYSTSNNAGPFTTTTPSITLVCSMGDGGSSYSVGTVGGNTATHFVQNGSGWMACQDYSTTSNLTSAYSVLSPGNLTQSVTFK